MRFQDVAVALIGAGSLALTAASCDRREPGAGAPPPAAAPAPALPSPSVPAPRPSPEDGGAGGASAAPGGGPGADAGVIRHQHRGASANVVERGSHGAIGKLKVEGRVARGDVERVLRDGLPTLMVCRADGSTGQGQVDLELTIGEQGWATLAEVKRTTLTGGDPELCIVKALRALRFPRPADGKDTAVWFVLRFR